VAANIEANPGNYDLCSNNCTTSVTKILNATGIEVNCPASRIPGGSGYSPGGLAKCLTTTPIPGMTCNKTPGGSKGGRTCGTQK
jgi:hypothetical protein